MAKRMRIIKDEAKKRRMEFLKQFNKMNITIAEFAELKQLTPARMGQILKKAKEID